MVSSFESYERPLSERQFSTVDDRSGPAGARRPVLAAKPKPGGLPAQRCWLLSNGKRHWYGFAGKTDVCRTSLAAASLAAAFVTRLLLWRQALPLIAGRTRDQSGEWISAVLAI
jgi:hypothetical protein